MKDEPFYASADVEVRLKNMGGSTLFVTFTALGPHLEGFGESFLQKRGYSAIHFISRWDHWWQPPSVQEAADRVRARLEDWPRARTVVYGASMGAYGAALYSRDMSADVAVLLAPQFSIDPTKPPFEMRWRREAARIAFLRDDMASRMRKDMQTTVIYDPRTADRAHVELFQRVAPVRPLEVRFAGHLPGHLLRETGLLERVLLDIAEDRFDQRVFRAELRRNRRRSPTYWAGLSERAQRSRPALALSALRQALALRPSDATYWLRAADLTYAQGQYAEVLHAAETASRLKPDHPAPWRAASRALSQLRRHDEAVRAAQKAVALRQGDADLCRVLAEVLMRAGRPAEAVDAATRAIALDRGYVPTYLTLAQACHGCGLLDEAIAAATEAVGRAPDHPRYRDMLAELEQERRLRSDNNTDAPHR